MDILIEQEIALHSYQVRQNRSMVARLLHPSFKEVGKSGSSYDFQNIVAMMEAEQPADGHIHAQDFECIQLSQSVYLLLYKSVWIDSNGGKSRFAKRSSIWALTGEEWRMKYHQGTPCAEFEL
ncbi:MAG: hypothetical protein OFPII_40840 [Osedax symbiont Rs1]|nr:MAG: hypothetical protein OFPII_40840 [Osedax symbiont Rs1]